MDINKKIEGKKLTVSIEGRLDTTTAPQLENELNGIISNIKDLVLDVSKMDYISLAGLRVLLSAQKTMNKQGSMTVTGANADVLEIFEVTGFADVLNIE